MFKFEVGDVVAIYPYEGAEFVVTHVDAKSVSAKLDRSPNPTDRAGDAVCVSLHRVSKVAR